MRPTAIRQRIAGWFYKNVFYYLTLTGRSFIYLINDWTVS